MGESIKIWLYITSKTRNVKCEERALKELFQLSDSTEVMDILELKRLSRSIASCIGAITGIKRKSYANERRDIDTLVKSYKEQLKRTDLSDNDRNSMTISLKESRSKKRNLDKIIEQPFKNGTFNEDYAIRALGYFLQKRLNVARIGVVTESNRTNQFDITDNSGIKYNIPRYISDMMRLKKGWSYIIIGSVIINGIHRVTLIIPPYGVMDSIIDGRENVNIQSASVTPQPIPEPVKPSQQQIPLQSTSQRLYGSRRPNSSAVPLDQ